MSTQPWTIKNVIEWTSKDFEQRGIQSAHIDTRLLLAKALGTTQLELLLHFDKPLTLEERENFRKMVRRRRNREPVAYLTQEKEFWSLPLLVTSSVLIPRPDTEVLVEEALTVLSQKGISSPSPVIVDIGTGSGCIALAVAQEKPDARVIGVDIDLRAASVAWKNCKNLQISHNVQMVVGDLMAPIGHPVDLILSNLPYIPSEEIDTLEPEISRYEPRLALDGGKDGLCLFRKLIAQAPKTLRSGGFMILEVGHQNQAREVTALFEASPTEWKVTTIRKDYSQEERVVVIQRK